MKIRDKKLLIASGAIIVIAIAAAVLRTVALLTDFDSVSGHFKDGTLFTVSTVIITVGVVFALLYPVFVRNDKKPLPDFHGAGDTVGAGVLALAFVFLAVDILAELFTGGLKGAEILLGLLAATGAVGAVVYLFFYPYLGRRYSEKRGMAGLFAIVCLAAYAVMLFIDRDLTINAPNKLVDQLAIISAALFFLEEVRLSLGREIWELYTALGMVSVLATAYSAIPTLAFYFTELVRSGRVVMVSNSIAGAALAAALFIFITVRLLKVAFLRDAEPGEVAEMISLQNAAKEEATVDEIEEPTSDENQISIDDIISESDTEQ